MTRGHGGQLWEVTEQGPHEGPRMAWAQPGTHKAQLLAQMSTPSLVFQSHLSHSQPPPSPSNHSESCCSARGPVAWGHMGTAHMQLYLLLSCLLLSLTQDPAHLTRSQAGVSPGEREVSDSINAH